MPAVSREGDSCTGHGGFPPRASTGGSGNVLVNGIGVHREGDGWATHCLSSSCHDSALASGSSTVSANGQGIARLGDPVACGSGVATGSGNVFCDDRPPSVQLVSGLGFFPSDEVQNEVKNAKPVLETTTTNAVIDEPEYEDDEEILISRGYDPSSAPSSVQSPSSLTDDVQDPNTHVIEAACEAVSEPLDYSMMLSPNVSLGSLSTNAVFPHSIKAQAGLSDQDIVCNLQALSVNVIEPIMTQFPVDRFNSGFRTETKGTSGHEKGRCVDLQWPGVEPSYYTEVCKWILENINFDTLGIEMGNSVWLHIEFRRGEPQRRRIFTYSPNTSPKYQFGVLINYQDDSTQIA